MSNVKETPALPLLLLKPSAEVNYGARPLKTCLEYLCNFVALMRTIIRNEEI